jgi:membrane protease YdiL (CAAX protease family)
VETSAVTQAGPAPGWYPDPVEQRSRRHAQRYWDGTAWTPAVADGERVSTDPMPPPLPDTRTALPGRAGWYALAGFVLGQALALGGALAGTALSPGTLVVRLVLSQAGLWLGLLGACVLASRRWGTGDLRADYAIRMHRSDVGRGLLLSLGARAVAVVVVSLVALLAPRLAGTQSGVFELVAEDRAALVALALMLVIGAPVIEEIFFRGLLLRSLRCRLTVPLAIAVQALAFGAVHVDPAQGWGNVGVVVTLVAVGVVLGIAAEHYRRLGPSMWAHAWFNLLPAALLVLSA